MGGGARADFYPGSTAGGTSAQHLAAYEELSYKWSHFISTTPWEGGREGRTEGGGLHPTTQRRTPRLREAHPPALAWSTPPPPRPSVHRHLRPKRMGGPLPSAAPSSQGSPSPAIVFRSPGRVATQDALVLCCSGCFFPQSSSSMGLACGPALWPPWGLLLWGPKAQLSQPNWPGTSLCPIPTSSSCVHQHLSLGGF